MFGAAYALLRWLWPFFLESIFKDSTFRQWMRGNLRQFIWMLLWVSLLLMLFQTIDLTHHAVEESRQLQQQLGQLQKDHALVTRRLAFKRELVVSLAKELDWTRKALVNRPAASASSAPPAPAPSAPPYHPPVLVSKALQDWSRDHPAGKP